MRDLAGCLGLGLENGLQRYYSMGLGISKKSRISRAFFITLKFILGIRRSRVLVRRARTKLSVPSDGPI